MRLWLTLIVVMSSLSSLYAIAIRPNILLFIADDLGYGDLGCFGNHSISTPNIDQLAASGMKLTHHLTAECVCTPSRAAMYTGRYAIRSGMAPTTMMKVSIFLGSTSGLPPNETTFAELAQEHGYKTAILGKWHLGVNCGENGDICHLPTNQGFDYYFGIPLTNLQDFGDDSITVIWRNRPEWTAILFSLPVINSLACVLLLKQGFNRLFILVLFIALSIVPFLFYQLFAHLKLLNSMLMRNGAVVEAPINLLTLTERMIEDADSFMENRKKDKQPFLLVMSWSEVHTYLTVMPQFRNSSKFGKYGDTIHQMDWATGQILESLKSHGFADDTFVYFGSDNGGHLEEKGLNGEREGGFNGILRGGKAHGPMEGGIRVPAIVSWPGNVKPGSVQNTPTSNMDVFPTVAHLVGANIPSDRSIDGKNMIPLLQDSVSMETTHRFIFHYCGESLQAVRYMPNPNDATVYKLYYAQPRYKEGTQQCHFICQCSDSVWFDPPELYDVGNDPGEQNKLDIRKFPEIRDKIEEAVRQHNATLRPTPNQMSYENLMWRPWLQPVCKEFPYFYCQDKGPLAENQVIP